MAEQSTVVIQRCKACDGDYDLGATRRDQFYCVDCVKQAFHWLQSCGKCSCCKALTLNALFKGVCLQCWHSLENAVMGCESFEERKERELKRNRRGVNK